MEKERKRSREGEGRMLTITAYVSAECMHKNECTVHALTHTFPRQRFRVFLLRPHVNLRFTGPMPSHFPKNYKVAEVGRGPCSEDCRL